jgi:hypothetical protein
MVKAMWLPHLEQKLRFAFVVDLRPVGVPLVHLNLATGNVIHVTTGAPEVRRQIVQWQCMTRSGLPSAA